MAFTIGGAPIEVLEYTHSWGLTPASASITCAGLVELALDDAVALAIGGDIFYGVVKAVDSETNRGTKTMISAVDNREWLNREDVYGAFNMTETIEDNLATPGIDRGRRFWSILPNDWETQTRTYHDEPLSAQAIIGYWQKAPTISFGWSFVPHAAQNEPVLAVDANNGAKLGNVLLEMSEKQGLVFSIAGFNELVWAKKGDGFVPSIPQGAFNIRRAEALSNCDTLIRVVGDRNRSQCNNVTLEPDWLPHFEQFWLESAWIARVSGLFGLSGGTQSQEAALFAKAKSVTVREYMARSGASLYDGGKWGQVSRMDIPAWIYLQDIVYKAYRVPRSFKIGNSDWASLRISEEGLLQEMTFDPFSGNMTPKTGGQQYIEEKMLILALGYKIDIIDPRYQRAITPDQLASQKSTWWPVGNYTIDPKQKTVVFQEPVFTSGNGENNDLFTWPNDGIDDTNLPTTHPCRYMVAPNADANITAAQVRATIVFEAERYWHDYGSGLRRGPHYVRGLRRDSVLNNGVFSFEVKYADGKSADEKSQQLGNGLVTRQAQYNYGGWSRRGVVGTSLSGVVDRVTYSLRWGQGIQEIVEFTKERSPLTFQHERMMDRFQRSKDLYPGHEKNREEVWELQTLAALGDSTRTHKPPVHTVQGVMGVVHGNEHPGRQIIDVGTESRQAGEVIWLDPLTGEVDDTAKVFGGVVIADGSTGRCNCATQGVVPVLVKGPVNVGDVVGETSGANSIVKAGGARFVGVANATYKGTEGVLIPVRLSGANDGINMPFQILKASAPPGSEDAKNWVQVALNSWLLEDADPTSKITITGLGAPFQLKDNEHIWLKIDLTATYTSGGGIAANIDHGMKWGADNKNFFPIPVEYDTDDGTRLSSSGTPPTNSKQIAIYIPIGYVEHAQNDVFGLIAGGFCLQLDDFYVIQQCSTHLMMGGNCIDGGTVQFANPSPYSPQPDPS